MLFVSLQEFEAIIVCNWNYSHDNVHDSFIDFYTKLEGSVNKHAPLKKWSPKEIKVKNKPWLNADILKMIEVRNKVFARKKRQPNNENYKQLYNLLRNRVNRELKSEKNNIMQIILRAILTSQKKNMGWYSGNCELKEIPHQNFTINYWWENN